MDTRLKRWLPVALCCLPGVAAAAVVGTGLTVGGAAFGTFFSGPLGLGLLALALLAGPVSMGLMMRRRPNRSAASGHSQLMADCCLPGEAPTSSEAGSPADRLARLRDRREALERELAEIQAE